MELGGEVPPKTVFDERTHLLEQIREFIWVLLCGGYDGVKISAVVFQVCQILPGC